MLTNHNILHKIIDIVVLNRWKKKIKLVNNKYHQKFKPKKDINNNIFLLHKKEYYHEGYHHIISYYFNHRTGKKSNGKELDKKIYNYKKDILDKNIELPKNY